MQKGVGSGYLVKCQVFIRQVGENQFGKLAKINSVSWRII